MSWVKIDDNAPDHPKVAALTDHQFRVWFTAIAYANRFMTDGLVSPTTQRMARCTTTDATALVRSGLWEIAGDGAFRIHDYRVYQPTRYTVLDRRASRSEAGRAGGIASARSRKLRLLSNES